MVDFILSKIATGKFGEPANGLTHACKCLYYPSN